MLLDLETLEDAGDEGWVQIDWVAGLNRLIGDRLKKHGSAWIVNGALAALGSRAASGADNTEQSREK